MEGYMENIIYYFSGTGNSLRTAVRIAENIGGAEIVSVRCRAEDVPAENAKVIGFVCPVYEWDIPGTMKKFAEKLKINPDAKYYYEGKAPCMASSLSWLYGLRCLLSG